MSLHEFFEMDGYAAFVWPCYALTLIVLIGMGWSSRRTLAAELTRAERRSKANQE